MSREIKFRQWASDRFVYWGFIKENGHTHFANPTSTMNTTITDWEANSQQYTGLKDKNGVEIYEGDIIKAKHDAGDYDTGSVVYGRKGAFCIDLPKVATGIKSPLLNYIHGMMFDESDIEVIGNIYENKELLHD